MTMNNISSSLKGSLAAYNGFAGKHIQSAEEFFDKWLAWESSRKNDQKKEKLLYEALANKAEALQVVSAFVRNHSAGLIEKIQHTIPPIDHLKKEKRVKAKHASFDAVIDLKPTADLDIFYISSGILTGGGFGKAEIRILKNNTEIITKQVSQVSINEADYHGLISTLKELGNRSAVIYSNSQLLVYTVNNKWKLKADNLKPLRQEAQRLLSGKNVQILWLPYSRNLAASIISPLHVHTDEKPRLNERQIDLSKITLSTDQETIFNLLNTTKTPIFLTGKAGTGKSLLLQYFRQKTNKNIVVCAPTGVAALNIRGQTIHSLFRLPITLIRKGEVKLEKNVSTLLQFTDIVVIDEVSMVRADIMDAIDHLLRQARKSSEPFGGVQIVMFGDLYQLPPIISDNVLASYFKEQYGGYFFYHADVWKYAKFERKELTTVFRQKDEAFRQLLNAMRDGTITDTQIEDINDRTLREPPSEGIITLTTINRTADKINKSKLDQLKGREFTYKAAITGILDEKSYPTDELLHLKEGAQVMLLRNDKEKHWVNGSLGIIESLKEDEIVVNIDGQPYPIPKESWEKIRYTVNETSGKIEEDVISSFTQFPLKLAWAITIHKSQGQTYPAVIIDLGFGAFAPGQTYVAFSRCQTLDGVYLKRPITRNDIIVDETVSQFMAIGSPEI